MPQVIRRYMQNGLAEDGTLVCFFWDSWLSTSTPERTSPRVLEEARQREPVDVAVETYRGIHLIFAGETRARKLVIDGQEVGDIKSGPNSYVVTPPSQVLQENGTLWEYRYIPGYEWTDPLPFPGHLFPEVEQTRITREKIGALDAYLAKIESRQGEHGSHGLVRAAAVCRDAGLSEAEATIKLLSGHRDRP